MSEGQAGAFVFASFEKRRRFEGGVVKFINMCKYQYLWERK